MYEKYKVGKETNIEDSLELEFARRIVCDKICGIDPKDIDAIKEKINIKIS